MRCTQPTLKLALAALLALQLTACAKTVRWEEEVPLNTGETVWVKRTVNYFMQGGAGNPFDMAYRPDWPEVIEFKWNGKNYRYEGDARVMVLAISPQKQPVLVAGAAAGAWDAKHDYKCVIPFYVQLIPDVTGKNWTWPPQIETWLYNLPPNLMLQRKAPDEMGTRYTAKQRQAEDYSGSIQSESQQKINPTYAADHCKTRR
jgi:hypothetical protein